MKPPCETAFRFNETAGLWPGGNRIEKIAGKSPSDRRVGRGIRTPRHCTASWGRNDWYASYADDFQKVSIF